MAKMNDGEKMLTAVVAEDLHKQVDEREGLPPCSKAEPLV